MAHNDNSDSRDAFPEVSELPPRTLATYARLWQLETWLRCMVYVELRSQKGDNWPTGIRNFDKSLKADKDLGHMPTPEREPLSYISFSELRRLITENWSLFSCYLPPQKIWDAKLDEITQIRHRIAHFRTGHYDDYQRVTQLLRDIDKGFWLFCTSYNDSFPALPPSDDPVTAKFFELNPFPYHQIGENKWAQFGHAPPSMVLAVSIEVLRREWAELHKTIIGTPGYLYSVNLIARGGRKFDYRNFLKATRSFHSHLVHICLGQSTGIVRLTIPAVLGFKDLIEIIERAIEVANYSIRISSIVEPDDPAIQRISDEWPEYVLGPQNPLTFLNPDMPCNFFDA